ncbi:MAG: hypothetical protein WC141_02450 [Arcobacteraceae bacterium]
MHTIKLHVEDSIYENIMFLLKNLKLDGLTIKEEKFNEPVDYEDWTKEELKNIGKIGFDSKSFIKDSEDYSKW